VTLTFELDDERKQKIVFSRTMQIKRVREHEKTSKGAIMSQLSDFQFYIDSSGKYQNFDCIFYEGIEQKPNRDAEKIRETFFPGLVHEYYLIYGERFVDPGNSEKIRLAIERNCYSQIFEKIKDNLENINTVLIKDSITDEKKKKKYVELLQEIRDNNDLINTTKDELSTFDINAVEIDKAIQTIDRKIGSSGIEYESLGKKRDDLGIRIKSLNSQIKNIDKEIMGSGFKTLIGILAVNSQKNLELELGKRIKKGEIPPHIKTEFIDTLIKKKICICNRKINKTEKQKLIELRDENVIGEYYNEFLNLNFSLKSLESKLKSEVTDYLKNVQDVEDLRLKMIEADKEQENISQELKSLEKTKDLEIERKKFEKHKKDIEREKDMLNRQIQDYKAVVDAAKINIKKLGVINTTNRGEIEKIIPEIILKLNETKEAIITSTRKDVEEFASQTYKKIYESAEEVKRIELDDKYNVRVILKKSGKDVVKSKFSTGESLVFAISFLTALRRFSGYTGPIFLDSPFSVLDPKHRVKVSLNIPKSIPGQLIILTRPDTFEDVKSKLKEYTNKIVAVVKEKEWHSKMV